MTATFLRTLALTVAVAAVSIALTMTTSREILVGEVMGVARTAPNLVAVEVRPPVGPHEGFLADARWHDEPDVGSWIVASSRRVNTERGPVLRAGSVWELPRAFAFPAQTRIVRGARGKLDSTRFCFVLGCCFLLGGLATMRLASTVLLAWGGAVLVWHGLALGEVVGLFPVDRATLTMGAASGMVAGTLVGLRSRGGLAEAAQKGAACLIHAALAPTAAELLGIWPELYLAAAVLGTLLSLGISVWLAGAVSIAAALSASWFGAWVILGTSAAAVHVVSGGRWLDEFDGVAQSRLEPALDSEDVQRSLADLLGPEGDSA